MLADDPEQFRGGKGSTTELTQASERAPNVKPHYIEGHRAADADAATIAIIIIIVTD